MPGQKVLNLDLLLDELSTTSSLVTTQSLFILGWAHIMGLVEKRKTYSSSIFENILGTVIQPYHYLI